MVFAVHGLQPVAADGFSHGRAPRRCLLSRVAAEAVKRTVSTQKFRLSASPSALHCTSYLYKSRIAALCPSSGDSHDCQLQLLRSTQQDLSSVGAHACCWPCN